MKLIKQVWVNGLPFTLVDDEIRLDLLSPGRASLSVISDKPLSGIVQIDIGYSGREVQRYFTGYIETSTQQDAERQMLFCRELTAGLNRYLPVSLRNTNLKDLLKHISEILKLNFIAPDKDYALKRIPFFYHLGGGYMALDACGPVFEIPDFIWQQQGDGSVFVGSWQDSRWASRPVTIPNQWLTDQKQVNQATIPLTPPLRPGIKFNDQYYINAVRIIKEKMEITWSTHLNG